MLALRLTSTGQLPSMLSNSQTPTQSSHTPTMLGTACGPHETLGQPWELFGRVVRTGWATTGTVWQWGQNWEQQNPATPNTPCWVFHHGQEAECFMCQDTIAGYSYAPHPYKTQATISPTQKWKNLRKLKWSVLFISKFPFPSFSSQCKACGPLLSSSLTQARVRKNSHLLLLQGKKQKRRKAGGETHKQQRMGTREKGTGREKSEEAAESLESANRSFQSTYLRG